MFCFGLFWEFCSIKQRKGELLFNHVEYSGLNSV